jgi:hypothetical protein
MTRQNRNFWIEVVLLVLIIAAIGTAIVVSEMRPLNKNDIKMDVSDLRSFAAVGRRLMEQHDRQQLTEQFFAAEVELLSDKVSSTKETLESSAQPDAENDRHEAADLSTHLRNAVDDLETGRTNGNSLGQVFGSIQTRSKQMEDRLSQ